MYLAGCSAHRFPQVLPIIEENREDIAKERAHEYFIQALDAERRGMSGIAENLYERAYELDPRSEKLRTILVERYVVSRKYKQALFIVKGQHTTEELSDADKRIVASLYVEMQQYQRAVETLEMVKSLTPVEHGTLTYLYERLNNYPQAVKHCEQYFNSNRQSPETGFKLADMYVRQQLYDKAESLYVYMDSVFTDKKNVILNGLGLIQLLKQDTAAAIHFFKTALMLDSNSVDVRNTMAQIYIARGEYTEAIAMYEKMTDNDYLTQFYHRRTLAMLYYYDKQYDKSGNILQSLLTENNQDYELHFFLGLVFAAQKKDDLAEIEFQKTLALQDTYVDGWLQLCYLTVRQKQWDKALDYARRFKEKLPENSASWRMYSYVLASNKKYKEAIEALKKAVTFNENDAAIWFELGSAYERNNNYKKAVEAFRKLLVIDPDDDAAANYLGYMWAEHDEKLDSAKMLLEMALHKSPENGAYLDSYGWIFFKLGDYDQAEKYIRKAMTIIDDDPIIYEHLGDILARKEQMRDALDAYKKCLELGAENGERIQTKIDLLQMNNNQEDSDTVPHENSRE